MFAHIKEQSRARRRSLQERQKKTNILLHGRRKKKKIRQRTRTRSGDTGESGAFGSGRDGQLTKLLSFFSHLCSAVQGSRGARKPVLWTGGINTTETQGTLYCTPAVHTHICDPAAIKYLFNEPFFVLVQFYHNPPKTKSIFQWKDSHTSPHDFLRTCATGTHTSYAHHTRGVSEHSAASRTPLARFWLY